MLGPEDPERGDRTEAGPRESSEGPAGVFARGPDGLWALAWACLLLSYVGRGRPSFRGRKPPLSGPSGGSLGLLMFGELLKPGADYGFTGPTLALPRCLGDSVG